MAITHNDLISRFKFTTYEDYGKSKLRKKIGHEYIHVSGNKLFYNGSILLDLDIVTSEELVAILARLKETIRKLQKDESTY